MILNVDMAISNIADLSKDGVRKEDQPTRATTDISSAHADWSAR